MPTRRRKDGSRVEIFSAITTEARNMLEEKVFAEYEKMIGKLLLDATQSSLGTKMSKYWHIYTVMFAAMLIIPSSASLTSFVRTGAQPKWCPYMAAKMSQMLMENVT